MRYLVTRDMTPDGDIVIWRGDAEPELDEQDGVWDTHGDNELLIVEVLSDDFEKEYELELPRGQKRYVKVTAEWDDE